MRRQKLKWIAGSFVLGSVSLLGNGLMPRCALAANTADLRETLEKGLFARLPEHFAFIDKVIAAIEQDKLPLPLVYSTYRWALKQDRGRRIYYFEQAMRQRAAKIGVDL